MLDNIKKVIPNIITTIRLLLALSIPFIFLQGYIKLSIVIFIIAALSDALDGYLARKWNTISMYGKIIDPLADKFLSIGILILIAIKINPILFIPLLMEAFIMAIALVTYRSSRKIDIEIIGKIKTGVLFPTVAIGLISYLYPTWEIAIAPLIGITAILQILAIREYAKRLFYTRDDQTIIIEEDQTITIVDKQ